MPTDNLMAEVYMKIEDIIDGINSGDENKEITATHAASKIGCREHNPAIDILINANVVPRLVEFLSRVNNPDLQLESAMVLTNITSGSSDQTKAVISAGAVAGLIFLLDSPHPAVAKAAVWALDNIARDERDYLIEQGVIKPLLSLIKPDAPGLLLLSISFTLHNFCLEKHGPLTVPTVLQLLPALAHIINNNDEDILAPACWALKDLTDQADARILEAVDDLVFPRLVALLDRKEDRVILPALLTIGNMYRLGLPRLVPYDWIKPAVSARAVPGLILLLSSPHPVLAEEAVRILGSIAEDGQELRDEVIEQGVINKLLTFIKPNTSVSLLRCVTSTLGSFCGNFFSPLTVPVVRQLLPPLSHLINNKDEEIVASACWALLWLTQDPNARIQEVVDAGVVPRLVSLLDRQEVAVIDPTLQIIGEIVKVPDTQIDSVLAAGLYPMLAKLLVHSEFYIVEQAAAIVSNIAAVHNVTRPLADVLSKGDSKCQKEAAWDITKITLGGVDETALLCHSRHRSTEVFSMHFARGQEAQDRCGSVELLCSYFGGRKNEESFFSRKKVLLGIHRS